MCSDSKSAVPAISTSPSDLVYKVCERQDWLAAETSPAYLGSSDDLRDGFIHLSAAHQLAMTLERHFGGRAGLVLIAFRSGHLAPALRWEPSRGGELFPHLYGPIAPGLALQTWPLPLDAGGRHILPELPEAPAAVGA